MILFSIYLFLSAQGELVVMVKLLSIYGACADVVEATVIENVEIPQSVGTP